jgi:hypothetical protein
MVRNEKGESSWLSYFKELTAIGIKKYREQVNAIKKYLILVSKGYMDTEFTLLDWNMELY